jgi:hypothetical protein
MCRQCRRVHQVCPIEEHPLRKEWVTFLGRVHCLYRVDGGIGSDLKGDGPSRGKIHEDL